MKCECGCDEETLLGKRFIANHHWRGRKHSTASKLLMSQQRKGRVNINEKNTNWSGDNVTPKGVHYWIRQRLSKPERCKCGKKTKYLDLANISQKYLRDLNDWEYLCRSCHMKGDGRMKNLDVTGRHWKLPYKRISPPRKKNGTPK